jgi:hypothetical protein
MFPADRWKGEVTSLLGSQGVAHHDWCVYLTLLFQLPQLCNFEWNDGNYEWEMVWSEAVMAYFGALYRRFSGGKGWRNLSQDSRPPVWDLNPELIGYEACVLSTSRNAPDVQGFFTCGLPQFTVNLHYFISGKPIRFFVCDVLCNRW